MICAERLSGVPEHGVNHPLHYQPECKQVQALESVKAEDAIVLKLPAGKYHDRRDPAHRRDVAKYGGDPRRNGSQKVRGLPAGGSLLGSATTCAVNIRAAYLIAAVSTKWHY